MNSKFIAYDSFHYIYPPRAVKALPSNFLSIYEKAHWWAQYKLNGTNSVIFVSPEKELTAMNRYKDFHKAWAFTGESSKMFKSLPGEGWWVFNVELMHSKTPHIKDTNYIHDVLVANGMMLSNTTYRERYEFMYSIFQSKIQSEETSHYVLNKNTWLAKNHTIGFNELFNSMDKEEHEGLVLKNPSGRWIPGKVDWLVKIRKNHKNFSF